MLLAETDAVDLISSEFVVCTILAGLWFSRFRLAGLTPETTGHLYLYLKQNWKSGVIS